MNWTAVTNPPLKSRQCWPAVFPQNWQERPWAFHRGVWDFKAITLRSPHFACVYFCSLPSPPFGKYVVSIERFHSRGQHLCKFIGTKESVCIRKEFNSHRTGLEHQHGRRFIVLGHQYGRREVMWKHSIFNFHWLAVWRCPGGCHSQGCHGSSLHSAAVLGCTSFSGTLPLRSTHEFNIKYKI